MLRRSSPDPEFSCRAQSSLVHRGESASAVWCIALTTSPAQSAEQKSRTSICRAINMYLCSQSLLASSVELALLGFPFPLTSMVSVYRLCLCLRPPLLCGVCIGCVLASDRRSCCCIFVSAVSCFQTAARSAVCLGCVWVFRPPLIGGDRLLQL